MKKTEKIIVRYLKRTEDQSFTYSRKNYQTWNNKWKKTNRGIIYGLIYERKMHSLICSHEYYHSIVVMVSHDHGKHKILVSRRGHLLATTWRIGHPTDPTVSFQSF